MSMIWFRKNLRVCDNQAISKSLKAEDSPTGVFIWPNKTDIFKKYSKPQIAALPRYLPLFSKTLADLGIDLTVLYAKDGETETSVLEKHLKKTKSKSLFYNQCYELNSLDQEKKIEIFCKKNNVSIEKFDDQLIIDPTQINNQSKNPFKVFTPFYKASVQHILKHKSDEILKKPISKHKRIKSTYKEIKTLFGVRSNLFEDIYEISEEKAQRQLQTFTSNKIKEYSKTRDFPFLDSTSHLSHFLSLGILTGKQCLHKALNQNKGHFHGGQKGIDTWITEVFWREFYRYIGIRYPQINKRKPFNEKTSKIPWKKSKSIFDAWCEGRTGIPFVDAGMRQLNTTGWIHNRLRMIVAMFLTKNCLIDWRWGEKYFFENLIDADFFSNNGGWQWSASTGTDAAPYFRIMNPITQSEKFDAEGKYIKKYIPELNKLSSTEIHTPYEYYDFIENYPKPIVPLKESRAEAIRIFKKHL